VKDRQASAGGEPPCPARHASGPRPRPTRPHRRGAAHRAHAGDGNARSVPWRAEIIAKAESGQGSPAQLATLFRVSRSTVQRVLREHRARQALGQTIEQVRARFDDLPPAELEALIDEAIVATLQPNAPAAV
jgi:uncharacterized protein (DUF433 family)